MTQLRKRKDTAMHKNKEETRKGLHALLCSRIIRGI
jgi:hypothetical protein